MIKLDLKYKDMSGFAAWLFWLLAFSVVFTVVMYFSDISIIEDREHLTSLISLSEVPHEIEGLAKVNKDICHI